MNLFIYYYQRVSLGLPREIRWAPFQPTLWTTPQIYHVAATVAGCYKEKYSH